MASVLWGCVNGNVEQNNNKIIRFKCKKLLNVERTNANQNVYRQLVRNEAIEQMDG